MLYLEVKFLLCNVSQTRYGVNDYSFGVEYNAIALQRLQKTKRYEWLLCELNTMY